MDLIIQLGGGNVQDVFLIDNGILKPSIILVNFDSDDPDDERTTKCDKLTAEVGIIPIHELPKGCDVEKLYKQWQLDEKKEKDK